MDLDSAIGKHTDWKLKFRFAIANEEQMDVATIAKDDCCELGQWLHGEAKTKFSQLASYSECVKQHAIFHLEAGKVADFINNKKYIEAEKMLDAGVAYAEASSAVAISIMRLRKDAAL